MAAWRRGGVSSGRVRPELLLPNDRLVLKAYVATSTKAAADLWHGDLEVEAGRVRWICRFRDLPIAQEIRVEGYWDVHRKHGERYVVEKVRSSSIPVEEKRIAEYLEKNIPGIGPKSAKTLLLILGPELVVRRLEEEPEVVRGIFPASRARKIEQGILSWIRTSESEEWIRDMTPKLMAAADISEGEARKIVAFFTTGEIADLVMTTNPYEVLEVPGFGWKKTDRLAQALGFAHGSAVRVRAALLHALELALRDGHTALPVDELLSRARNLSNEDSRALEAQLNAAVEDRLVYLVSGSIQLPRLSWVSDSVAEKIKYLSAKSYDLSVAQREVVDRLCEKRGLTREQAHAVRASLESAVSVIIGGPGTGKTFTVSRLIDIHRRLGREVTLLAPTGKAAMRMREVSGVDATTIHKALGGPVGGAREDGPLPSGTIVVDEAGMVDEEVAAWLLENITIDPALRLILVGDAHQLPSVGPGDVLTDVTAENSPVTTSTLSVVQRQGVESPIVLQAARLRDGRRFREIESSEWEVVTLPSDPDRAFECVGAEYSRVVREEMRYNPDFDPVRDLVVLTPRNGGSLGVEALNGEVRRRANPRGVQGPYLSGGIQVRRGDRVVSLQNDYALGAHGVMNGESGVARDVTSRTMVVDLGYGRVEVGDLHCRGFALGYATTVHRSQGSEVPVVIVVAHESHAPVLDAKVLYTAITRARRRVVLLTTDRALSYARTGGRISKRQTTLDHLLGLDAG